MIHNTGIKDFDLYTKYIIEALELYPNTTVVSNDTSYELFFDKKNIIHIIDLLQDLKISKNLKDYNLALYSGKYIQKFDFVPKYEKIIQQSQAKQIFFQNHTISDGFDIYKNNKKLACLKAGDILLNAYDRGADYLIVTNTNAYNMFVIHKKDIEKYCKQKIPLPILTMPKLIYILLDLKR